MQVVELILAVGTHQFGVGARHLGIVDADGVVHAAPQPDVVCVNFEAGALIDTLND